MDFYQFSDQSAVERESQKVLNKILSDKSYTNPEKLSLLLSEYEKKQVRLDAQLSKAIKSQIQSINQSKQSVSQANNWMKEANDKTTYLREVWNQQYSFHELMEDIKGLRTYKNNIGKVVEQLTYFIDMENEMSKLQKMLEDETKFVIVNNKLLNLLALRDALSEDSSWKRETAIMRKQFVKVDNFQITFYDKICENFHDCLKVAKENASSLIISVKVVEAYDKSLEERGKGKVMRHRAIQIIKSSIDNKFSEKLQGQDELIGIIQNAKFATTDLVEISDYVEPCFPKDFPIMQIFQKQYQDNIEKHIIPFFDQIEQQAQYGNLVALLGWIDDYETLLTRAGLDSTNLVDLKSKVKILMPQFIEHNQNLVHDYISRCIEEDKKNYKRSFYEQVLRDGSDLISFFPSDTFRFINQEAQLIKDSLKGEIFVEFVRCITQTLSIFQVQLAEQLLSEFQTIKMVDNQEKIVEFEYKCILFINNYNECLKHASQSKELFTQIVSGDYKPRIQKIFLNEVQKQFNLSIPKFIQVIVKLIFMNMVQTSFPSLFTLNWLSDNSRQIMSQIMKTMAAELGDIENDNLILNIIHYRMLVKEALDFLVNAYIEQLIVSIRVMYNIHTSESPKYCSEVFTQKKLGQGKDDPKNVFNSRVAISEAIKKDKQCYIKFTQSFSESTSKMFINKHVNKFIMLGDLFLKKEKDFENLITKVPEVFVEEAADLVQAIFMVRSDIEARDALKPKGGIVVPI